MEKISFSEDLGRVIVELNEKSIQAINYIIDYDHPFYEYLTGVYNSGKNILFGLPWEIKRLN